MSGQFPDDPRLEQAGATDESLLSAHEKVVAKKSVDSGHYRMLPLALLFIFSGLIFFSGTYLNRYSGHYHPEVFDEHGHPSTTPGGAAPKLDPLVLGKRSYDQVCVACHQPTGQGIEGIYPPLAGSEWVVGSPDRVIRIVSYGLKGPLTVKDKHYSAAAMPAFGKVTGGGYNWNDDRIAAVISYVRQAWGNTAGPVTAEQVAAVHTQVGDRKEWSQEELQKVP